ncbi:MAG: histidinol dehydrogenase [Deltaproteobacteria bacterium]|nr:histidinol dehydrogenase [Deltaproteobacteria bacterium]
MLALVSPRDPDYRDRLAALARRTADMPPEVEAAARVIVAEVRKRGDAAVIALTERFEKRTLARLELDATEWDKQAATVKPSVRAALELAARRIRAFAEAERPHAPTSFEYEQDGITLGSRVTPLHRVGIYVPGGTALYPSTVLMTAIPARVAGVSEIIMVTPGPSPEALCAARLAGVDRVFVIGGAQAIAALAYGTESVPRVDKIVGPGNAYVTAAKRIVFGDVGIDSIAGPTEVVIACDGSVAPEWVAADLLAQAEHDVLAAPILVAVGRSIADAVNQALALQLEKLPRKAIAARAIADHGLAIVVDSPEAAIKVVNDLAPEHAEIILVDARRHAQGVSTAGAVFIGRHTPESVGDYVAGPSHVLPTGGSARFSSPLGVADFLKRSSIIEYSEAALLEQADAIEAIAYVEGLHAHGLAVTVRR